MKRFCIIIVKLERWLLSSPSSELGIHETLILTFIGLRVMTPPLIGRHMLSLVSKASIQRQHEFMAAAQALHRCIDAHDNRLLVDMEVQKRCTRIQDLTWLQVIVAQMGRLSDTGSNP